MAGRPPFATQTSPAAQQCGANAPSSLATGLQASTGSSESRKSERKFSPPQRPGKMPNRLLAVLARNTADKCESSFPYPASSSTLPPAAHQHAHTAQPKTDRLLKWRPVLGTNTSPSSEDLERHYCSTNLRPSALEPSTHLLCIWISCLPHVKRLEGPA